MLVASCLEHASLASLADVVQVQRSRAERGRGVVGGMDQRHAFALDWRCVASCAGALVHCTALRLVAGWEGGAVRLAEQALVAIGDARASLHVGRGRGAGAGACMAGGSWMQRDASDRIDASLSSLQGMVGVGEELGRELAFVDARTGGAVSGAGAAGRGAPFARQDTAETLLPGSKHGNMSVERVDSSSTSTPVTELARGSTVSSGETREGNLGTRVQGTQLVQGTHGRHGTDESNGDSQPGSKRRRVGGGLSGAGSASVSVPPEAGDAAGGSHDREGMEASHAAARVLAALKRRPGAGESAAAGALSSVSDAGGAMGATAEGATGSGSWGQSDWAAANEMEVLVAASAGEQSKLANVALGALQHAAVELARDEADVRRTAGAPLDARDARMGGAGYPNTRSAI